jgi:hypothetical protein
MKSIVLTRNKTALVDDKDYKRLKHYNWQAKPDKKTCYAIRFGGVLMHRQIMGLRRGDKRQIDHKNGNGIDNRRENLRISSHIENCQNRRLRSNTTSKYKGVCWHKNTNKWQCRITQHKKVICLGYYSNEIDAAKAYDKTAKRLFGEFARLNLPEKE